MSIIVECIKDWQHVNKIYIKKIVVKISNKNAHETESKALEISSFSSKLEIFLL